MNRYCYLHVRGNRERLISLSAGDEWAAMRSMQAFQWEDDTRSLLVVEHNPNGKYAEPLVGKWTPKGTWGPLFNTVVPALTQCIC